VAGLAGLRPLRFEALPGDVGARRYFRLFLNDNRKALAVVYPPEESDTRRRWNLLREALAPRVRVPEVLADDGGEIQIVEDFGERSLARLWYEAAPAERKRLAGRACEAAARLAGAQDPGANPPFSADFFRSEMEASAEAVFALAGRDFVSPSGRANHSAFARALSAEIASHPQTFVHRDFHADNLFDVDGEMGVIDFQDARRGPDSYDVASFTRERATALQHDSEAESEALNAYETLFPRPPGFRERMLRVRLQRAWKAAGTFARVFAASGSALARRYLSTQVITVQELLQASGPEGHFRELLLGLSAKLFGKEEVPC
jgi:aminoglycoside/choline kinase family phosphotransferase